MAVTEGTYEDIYKSKGTTTFLPDPERRERKYLVFSADDHLVEPPWTFEGRMPAKYAERAPKVIEVDNGGEAWVFDGVVMPNVGFNSVVGRPIEEMTQEPTRFEHMRRGAWDIHHRIVDMNLDGTYASLNFPSFLAGFGGARLQTVTKDVDLAFAAFQAYNDWHIEEWAGSYPERIVPCQIPWLHDPEIAAAEIRKNAERGFKAVSFPEFPNRVGFHTLFGDYWDPFFRACAETETVICLHVGSGGPFDYPDPAAPPDIAGPAFAFHAQSTATHWLHSKVGVRFPNLKIVLSEGGIGWVPPLLDRLDHDQKFSKYWGTWNDTDVKPAEVLTRNFWFCAINEPSSLVLRDRIGKEHILLEVDYPHADSTWPDTQATFVEAFKGLPDEDVQLFTWKNASKLFRHPVPEDIQKNYDLF